MTKKMKKMICPSIFSLPPLPPLRFFAEGLFCACNPLCRRLHAASLCRGKTVFPLGQLDKVRGAVRIPSGGVFLCLRLWGVPAHRSRLPTPARASPRFCRQAERAGCRGRRLSGSLRVCVSRGRVFPRFGAKARKWGVYGVLAFWRLFGGCGRLFWGFWRLRPPVSRFCGAAICPSCHRRPLIAALCV